MAWHSNLLYQKADVQHMFADSRLSKRHEDHLDTRANFNRLALRLRHEPLRVSSAAAVVSPPTRLEYISLGVLRTFSPSCP